MKRVARRELSVPKKEYLAAFMCHAASYAWKECENIDAAIVIMETLRQTVLEVELISPVDVRAEEQAMVAVQGK